MGRRTTSTSYITPIKASDGSAAVFAPGADATVKGRGVYTLEANTAYVMELASEASPMMSLHAQWDAAIVITSITVEDTDFPPDEAPLTDVAGAGLWIDEDPTTAFVGTVSAGTTVSNGVVAHTAGAAGGAMFHINNNAARRTRVRVQVGATGGEARFATWSKE